jgi:hypothetical protein
VANKIRDLEKRRNDLNAKIQTKIETYTYQRDRSCNANIILTNRLKTKLNEIREATATIVIDNEDKENNYYDYKYDEFVSNNIDNPLGITGTPIQIKSQTDKYYKDVFGVYRQNIENEYATTLKINDIHLLISPIKEATAKQDDVAQNLIEFTQQYQNEDLQIQAEINDLQAELENFTFTPNSKGLDKKLEDLEAKFSLFEIESDEETTKMDIQFDVLSHDIALSENEINKFSSDFYIGQKKQFVNIWKNGQTEDNQEIAKEASQEAIDTLNNIKQITEEEHNLKEIANEFDHYITKTKHTIGNINFYIQKYETILSNPNFNINERDKRVMKNTIEKYKQYVKDVSKNVIAYEKILTDSQQNNNGLFCHKEGSVVDISDKLLQSYNINDTDPTSENLKNLQDAWEKRLVSIQDFKTKLLQSCNIIDNKAITKNQELF